MKCLICKMGETSAGNVAVTLQRGELTVLIKNVPADVCENCGEYYLSDDTTDKVLKQAVAERRWEETQEALESVNQGKVVSGERVHEWLASWGSDDELSAPVCFDPSGAKLHR